jgi:hypothetical protein
MPGRGGTMKYGPAESWRRWITRLCWVPLQLMLGSAFLLAGEVKSFNLAGLKLLPTPWDRAANFAKFEHYVTGV